MDEELKASLEERFEKLKKYGWSFPQEELDKFYETLRGLRSDEVEGYIDKAFDKVIQKIERDRKNEMARNGQFDSMKEIRELVDVLLSSEIGPYIEIYGGTVPYFMTGETPKRMFGDVDIYVPLQDMSEVRRVIKEHPELFEVVLDTKDEMRDDFGLEIRVNGTDVTLFPAFYTDEGRVVRNFEYSNMTNVITAKETLFYGLTEENATTTCIIEGHEAKVEVPEIIYCQKSVARREKDLMDLEVLSGLVTQERVGHYSSLMQTPKRLKTVEVERGSYIPVSEQTTADNDQNKKNTI